MNGSLSRLRISRKNLSARVLAVSGLGLLALLASSLFSSAPQLLLCRRRCRVRARQLLRGRGARPLRLRGPLPVR